MIMKKILLRENNSINIHDNKLINLKSVVHMFLFLPYYLSISSTNDWLKHNNGLTERIIQPTVHATYFVPV